MAKGQQKSNKEIKKPKQKKTAAAGASPFEKGILAGADSSKKKG